MWILPITYFALIWFLSSYPSDAFINTGLSFDGSLKEAMHLIEFAGLYMLLVLALMFSYKLTNKTNTLAVIIAVSCALLDEVHQYYVPYRSAELVDIVKNVFGVLVAWYIVKQAYFRHNESLNNTK
ncbi:MAG: hypothetical protein FH758_06110 [Firmicutes bacterium]|nr:hypothetical protein [Bacillota bacterium]